MRLFPLVFIAALAITQVRASDPAPVPNFKLKDANPYSVRYGVEVSPRDYLLQVSGYYFGAAG